MQQALAVLTVSSDSGEAFNGVRGGHVQIEAR